MEDPWHGATIDTVKEIVASDLESCDALHEAAFARYAVDPFVASIIRHGKRESVVVVARNGDEVIYYEDVEEGFNVSPISQDGEVLEHRCNQDELGFALNAWIERR